MTVYVLEEYDVDGASGSAIRVFAGEEAAMAAFRATRTNKRECRPCGPDDPNELAGWFRDDWYTGARVLRVVVEGMP